jgi:hypothetical protein
MKKTLKVVAIALAVLIVGLSVTTYLIINRLTKGAVETLGPQLTKTSVKVESVWVSPFGGRGDLKNLVVGNPEGYRSPQAVAVGEIVVDLDLSTLLSEPLVIEELTIRQPQLTYEQGAGGSNLDRLIKNVEEASAGTPSRKIIIKHFAVRDGAVYLGAALLMGKTVKVPFPDMEMSDIGEEKGGVTASEAFAEIARRLYTGPLQAVRGPLQEALKQLPGLPEGLPGLPAVKLPGAVKSLLGK